MTYGGAEPLQARLAACVWIVVGGFSEADKRQILLEAMRPDARFSEVA